MPVIFFPRTWESTEYTVLTHIGVGVKKKKINVNISIGDMAFTLAFFIGKCFWPLWLHFSASHLWLLWSFIKLLPFTYKVNQCCIINYISAPYFRWCKGTLISIFITFEDILHSSCTFLIGGLSALFCLGLNLLRGGL